MESGKDLALVIAWPQCWAKAPESVFEKLKNIGILHSIYFQIGHAGIVLVNGTNGQVEYFDFGRYATGAYQGRVRSRRSDPKLGIDVRAKFDLNGDLENYREVLWSVKSRQDAMHGEGAMHVAICEHFNYPEAKRFAESLQDTGTLDYGSVVHSKINCANFVQKTLLKGIKCKKTKFHLRFPLTLLLPTPLGNVEAIRTSQNYIITDRKIITKQKLNQWAVVKQTYRSVVVNLTRKKLDVKPLNYMKSPTRHPKIPLKAQWLGGQGEGAWLVVMPLENEDAFYRVKGISANGETEYDYIAKANAKGFNTEKPHQFMPACSRLGVTIIQDSQKIRLTHHRDF